MFDDIDKIQFLLIAAGVIFAFWARKCFRPKTWISIAKNGNALTPVAYMDYERPGDAPEMHLTHDGINKPVARILNEGEKERPEVWMFDGELDDDSQNEYRLRGFIDEKGIIYKQNTRGQEPKAIGYTARPSSPNNPTIRGERYWTSFWLDSELLAFSGAPNPNDEDPFRRRVAEAHLSGVCIRDKRCVSTEAKACTAALFYRLYGPKEEQSTIYKDPAYGWRDTALFTSIVYSILFLLLYFVYACIFNKPLLGNDWQAVIILSACYFGLWAIIRQIKINGIENGESFQPQLDLLNKSIGHRKTDYIITGLAALCTYFAFNYYDFDFLPLIFAISFGISRNKMNKSSLKPWTIIANYDEEHNDIDEDNEPKEFTQLTPPSGNVSKTFSWHLDKHLNKNITGNITLGFNLDDLNIEREENPHFMQRKNKNKQDSINYMIKKMLGNKEMMERSFYIASYIKHESRIAHLDEMETLQFALDFVQEPNIAFVQSKDSKSIQFAVDYMRYPDETLYDQEGDSGCKSLLAAMLLHNMGYNVLLLSSEKYQHSAIGIEFSQNSWIGRYYSKEDIQGNLSAIEFNHRTYLYCETTNDGFQIGHIIPDMRIDDFETKVELLVSAEEDGEDEVFE